MLARCSSNGEGHDFETKETGQSPQLPQGIIPEESLERMGKELIRLCDSMERHGLVDYQMGVWEEEIIGSEFSSRLR